MPQFVFSQITWSFGQCACAADSEENNRSEPVVTGALAVVLCCRRGRKGGEAEQRSAHQRGSNSPNPEPRHDFHLSTPFDARGLHRPQRCMGVRRRWCLPCLTDQMHIYDVSPTGGRGLGVACRDYFFIPSDGGVEPAVEVGAFPSGRVENLDLDVAPVAGFFDCGAE
jgi:hypothetical protein